MILQRQDVYMLLSILVNIENRGSFFFFIKFTLKERQDLK